MKRIWLLYKTAAAVTSALVMGMMVEYRQLNNNKPQYMVTHTVSRSVIVREMGIATIEQELQELDRRQLVGEYTADDLEYRAMLKQRYAQIKGYAYNENLLP